jgi:hypothetical protein
MLLEEMYDADEILRDIDEHEDEEYYEENDVTEMRELNFEDRTQENANFSDMVNDMDNVEDLWE